MHTKNGATPAPGVPDQKTIANAAAQFALRGHCLRSHAKDDGSASYSVSRWNQSAHFTAWPDVLLFLEKIGGKQ